MLTEQCPGASHWRSRLSTHLANVHASPATQTRSIDCRSSPSELFVQRSPFATTNARTHHSQTPTEQAASDASDEEAADYHGKEASYPATSHRQFRRVDYRL